MLNNNKFILTIDVEDWAQSTFDNELPINKVSEKNTDILLDILNQYSSKATMFVLGKFAECFPQIIKKIKEEGHEIASHGYSHKNLLKINKEQLKIELDLSKNILEDLIGNKVIGFRAPDFSINIKNINYLKIIKEAGYEYDSSIFPIKLWRYGISNWPAHPVYLNFGKETKIYEFPIGISEFCKVPIPIGGGGYHRLFPLKFIIYFINKALKQNKYFVMYCHPYEFNYNEFKELHFKIPFSLRITQGLGRKGFNKKFKILLKKYKSLKIEEVIKISAIEDYVIND